MESNIPARYGTVPVWLPLLGELPRSVLVYKTTHFNLSIILN